MKAGLELGTSARPPELGHSDMPHDIIEGILGIVGEVRNVTAFTAERVLLGEHHLIVIQTFVFVLLFIGSRLLISREV